MVLEGDVDREGQLLMKNFSSLFYVSQLKNIW